MSKNIIFCADGTWNGAPRRDDDDIEGHVPDDGATNVVKLFHALAGEVSPETLKLVNEHEKFVIDNAGQAVQVAKYMHGVGDSKNLAIKFLGGVFGIGVVSRIVRGYTFISRYYEPGDRIYIIGFSRGAYTARALAGLIANVGLLDKRRYDVKDKNKAYRLGVAAWNKSKQAQINAKKKELSGFLNRVLDAVQDLASHPISSDMLIPNVPIEAVAVWDTVGSLGIPAYIKDERMDLYSFTDTALSPKVKNGLHAMAIDEQRIDFPVTRWDPRDGIHQVWFVGAHGDVGGGYASNESALSDIALSWMMGRLAALGMEFHGSIPAISAASQEIHKPWAKLPFSAFPRAGREPKADDTYHSTVVARFKADEKYRPFTFAREVEFDLAKLRLDA